MPFGSAGAGEESESLLPSSGEVEDVEENVLSPGPSFAPDPSQNVIVITPEKIVHNGNSSIPDLNLNPPDPECKPLIKKDLDPSSYVNPGYEDGEDPPSTGDLPVEEKIEEPTPQDNKKEEDEDEKLPSVPFYSLYRFATCKDILILLIGAFCAIICGFLSPIGNITFGRFAKAMIEKGTAMANSTCPPLPSNGTSDFMHKVYIYMEFQTGLGASQFILGYVMVMSYNIVAENQVFKLRLHYFRSLLRQDIGWFDASSKRNFSIKIIEDMLKIQTALSEKIPMTIFNLTTFAIFFATSFYYGWKLSAVMSSMVPVVAGVVVAQGFVSSHITASEQKSYAEAGAVAEEAITNIRTVVAFNGQEKETQRYGLKLDKAKRTSVQKGILLGLGNGAGWLVYFVNYSLAFWYGTKLVLESRENHDGQYGPDVLVIVLFGLVIGSWSIGSTSEYFEAFGAGKGAARGIYPVLNRSPTIDNMSRDGSKPTRRVTGEIEFENIEFAYPTRSTVQVLKNFSLKIKPKTTVAIVGSSGSGKSTCMQLIQRFYDPQGGAVKIDGVDIKECNVEWLRSQIGIVSQEPVLFGGSVGDNIKLGLKGSTNAQMRAATCQAYAHDFISKFPKKYETIAGERGTQLSGGEKQRIAISRALIRNPPILLLDEATSALDMQSESIVQEALECAKSGRTTIIIAHRLSTIRAADVVVVLSEGRVAESGSHEELMKLRGIYYGLVNTQEECAEIERKSRDLLLQKGIVGDVPLEDICPVSQSDLAKASGATGSGDRKSVVMSEDIRKEEERLKKEFRMREFIKMCLSEWKPLLASVVCTVVKSCGLPFYSIIFGSYLALFASEDNEYIRTTGNLYSLIFVGIALVMGVMSFFQRMFANTAEYNLTLRMRRRLFKYVMEQDMTFFDEADNNVGQLTSRLSTDCTSIQGAAGSRLVGLSQAFTIVVMSTVMSFYFLPKMAAVTFIFVPLVIFSSFIEGRVLGEENVTEKVSIETAANVAVEALNNIRTVASLGLESHFMEKYTEALSEAHRINLKRAHIRGIVYAFVYTVPYLAYGLSVFYGSYLVETECADIGDVFKVAEALIFGTMSGGAALAFAPDYDKGKIAASRIMKLFQRKPLIDPLIETGQKIDNPQGQVEFSKIKFAYPSRPNITILKDFEFQVVPGQSVAVVGPSGSGKSTMAALLMRFYDPAEGKVVVDSLDVKTLNLYYLRSLLATVSQEPILFDCTIKENIAYGDNSREIPPDEIIAVARQANIHHFISQLPAAYDTRVGSLGNQLSGGQKQRVAIARALLRRPKILILDEATSALDVQSESIVQKALDAAKEGRTCITVAHRLSSVKNSDVLLVMKDGQIIEAGTHDELLSEKGLYYTMWFAQLKHRSGGSL